MSEKKILQFSPEDLLKEEWRDIPCFEGFYQVSNLGRIKILEKRVRIGNNTRIIKERIANPYIRKNGYIKITLYKPSCTKNFFVHRLVAIAFIDNPNNYPIINHKDENPSNNRMENLEWCTYQYNNTYGTCRQKRAKSIDYAKITANTDYAKRTANTDYAKRTANTDWESISRKLTNNPKRSIPVLQFDLQGNFIKEFTSVMQCEREGFYHSNVIKCCRNKFHRIGNNKYKGYIWKYKDDSRI